MKKLLGWTAHYDDGTQDKFRAEDMIGLIRTLSFSGAGGGGKYRRVDEAGCPDHGEWKVVPGGISKKSGKAYDAFVTCHEDDCLYRPTKDIEKALVRGGNDATQVAPEPAAAPTQSAADFDDLPF